MKDKKEVVRKLKEAFAIGADVTAACSYAEISRETFYTWCKEDKKLAEESDSLREKPVLKAYQTVASKLGEIDTAKWYLERKRKREFSSRMEYTGEDGGPIEHDILGAEAKKRLKKYKTDGDV